ncbi:MAG: ATP-binding protein, partial [Deltaproteobacteria bacterium]|nr:ATP-binding protein [Deltaproteobacteria bacterium]
ALFRGQAELFAGLKIAQLGYEFKKYPVLHLDMSLGSSSQNLLESLRDTLNKLGNAEGKKKFASAIPGLMLDELVDALIKKYHENVVMLIDEYDYPVSHNIGDTQLANANSAVLSDFYASLKSISSNLRFVMVTGVTRYAMMGLSAGLNQLVDISFDPEYAAICGFTPDELDQYFGDRYDSVLDHQKSIGEMPAESSTADLRQKILDWYDGYTWDGRTQVLNPISILFFFQRRYFKEYWNASSPSTDFLKNKIASNPLSVTKNNFQGFSERDLSLITVGELATVPFLFHTGYLTIDKIVKVAGKDQYSFKVPNFELKGAIYDMLLLPLSSLLTENIDKESINLNKAIKEQDGLRLTQIIKAVFSRIPAQHYGKQIINEYYFHDLLLAYFFGLVAEVRPEEPGPLGNLDLILVTYDDIHAVIEIKYAKSVGRAGLEEALDKLARQGLKAIKEKKYGETYRLAGHDFVSIGLGVIGLGEAKAVFGEPLEPTAMDCGK